MSLVINTYQQTLQLNRESAAFKSQLCITQGCLASLQAQKASFLHPVETAYFSTLKFDLRQRSYLLGRYCAKQALAGYTGISTLHHFNIDRGIFEQPIVSCPCAEKIQVSISHSNQTAIALAFPEAHPMGIDLERIQDRYLAVIQSQLTAKELELFHSSSDPNLLSTVLWTAKEALSKVLRTGLMGSFEALAIQHLGRQENNWISEFQHFAQYQAFSFLLGDFICSIVLPKRTKLSIDVSAIQKWVHDFSWRASKAQ